VDFIQSFQAPVLDRFGGFEKPKPLGAEEKAARNQRISEIHDRYALGQGLLRIELGDDCDRVKHSEGIGGMLHVRQGFKGRVDLLPGRKITFDDDETVHSVLRMAECRYLGEATPSYWQVDYLAAMDGEAASALESIAWKHEKLQEAKRSQASHSSARRKTLTRQPDADQAGPSRVVDPALTTSTPIGGLDAASRDTSGPQGQSGQAGAQGVPAFTRNDRSSEPVKVDGRRKRWELESECDYPQGSRVRVSTKGAAEIECRIESVVAMDGGSRKYTLAKTQGLFTLKACPRF
jgi:hypothetical protein